MKKDSSIKDFLGAVVFGLILSIIFGGLFFPFFKASLFASEIEHSFYTGVNMHSHVGIKSFDILYGSQSKLKNNIVYEQIKLGLSKHYQNFEAKTGYYRVLNTLKYDDFMVGASFGFIRERTEFWQKELQRYLSYHTNSFFFGFNVKKDLYLEDGEVTYVEASLNQPFFMGDFSEVSRPISLDFTLGYYF